MGEGLGVDNGRQRFQRGGCCVRRLLDVKEEEMAIQLPLNSSAHHAFFPPLLFVTAERDDPLGQRGGLANAPGKLLVGCVNHKAVPYVVDGDGDPK